MIKLTKKIISATKRIDAVLSVIYDFKSDPLANLKNLEKGLSSHPDSIDDKHHKQIVKRIIASYYKIKSAEKNAPSIYRPATEWGGGNRKRRNEYVAALEKNNISKLSDLFRNSFRNSGVMGLSVYGHYSDIKNGNILKKKWFVNNILAEYSIWKNFVNKANIDDISTPLVGNPWGYFIKDRLIMSTSFRHHYWANHAKNLTADIKRPIVAEIGGGFGGVAYHLLKSNNKTKYINFDVPETLIMEYYYLLCAFPEKKFLLFGENTNADKQMTIDLINSYDIILLPSFQITKLPPSSVDLFINTASLSEMKYETVKEYISQIIRTCKLYFFHENSDIETKKGCGHIEVPSSRFPIPNNIFKRIYKSNSLWGGGGNRYREHLYQRIQGIM